MLSSYQLLLLLLLLSSIKLISTEEISIQDHTQSIISTISEMSYEKIYHEIHNDILPSVRRMSSKIQSMIMKITRKYEKMQEYKDVINQSCLSSSLLTHVTQLSRNLTQIVQIKIPSIEQDLHRIVTHLEPLYKQITDLIDSVKQQSIAQFNREQLQRFRTLTDPYQELNKQLHRIYRDLTQITNEILRPGLDSVDKYNKCLGLTAQSLIDHSVDQILEHIDDYDDEFFSSIEPSSMNNHTDL